MAINMRSANQISLKIWQVSGVFIRADSNLALRAHRATEPSLLSLRESGTLIGRDGETYRLRLRFFVEDLQFTSDQKGCSVFDGSICEIFVQKSAQNQQRDFSWTATLRLSSRAMILRKGFLLSPDERRRRENPCRDLVLYGTREVSLFGPAPEEYPFETSPVDVLPHLEEIQRSICSFMDAEGLVKLSYVCSSWQRQSERNEWWEVCYEIR
mmetsp:Transcript_67382/g.185701  ORF Transcript_67382/g.185701 Transcript_67382/m.185701 type:complete len:212 (+) Transcript_67382:40-675(+)